MAGTILPFVYGERQTGRRPITLWLHTLGCVVGAIAMGSLIGALGAMFPWRVLSINQSFVLLIATGFVSLLYSARELNLVAVPTPQCKWQVPSKLRYLLPHRATAFLYGLGLGFGLATRIPVSTFYVAVLWAALVNSPMLGALGMAMFGVGRASPILLMAWLLRSDEDSFHYTLSLGRLEPVVHLVNGLALNFAGSCLLVSGITLR